MSQMSILQGRLRPASLGLVQLFLFVGKAFIVIKDYLINHFIVRNW